MSTSVGTTVLGVDEALRKLDRLTLPPHTFASGREREWTMPTGRFTLVGNPRHTTEPQPSQLVFRGGSSSGWSVHVPSSEAGLRVLREAMVAAGAVAPQPEAIAE